MNGARSGATNHERLCLMPNRLVIETNVVGVVTACVLVLGTCYFMNAAVAGRPWPLAAWLVLLVPILPFLLPAGIASWLDAHTYYETDEEGFTRSRPHRSAERVAYEDMQSIRAGTKAGGRHLELRYRRTDGKPGRISVPINHGHCLTELLSFLSALLDSPAALAFDSPVRRLVLSWRRAVDGAVYDCASAAGLHSRKALIALAGGLIDAAMRSFERAEKSGEVRIEEGLMLMTALDEIESNGL